MDAAHYQEIYRIESTRLKGWDYSRPGWYFLTFCTDKKRCYFDNSVIKRLAEDCWREVPEHFDHAHLGDFIVMPNHMHVVVEIKPVIFDPVTNHDPFVETHCNASLQHLSGVTWFTPLTKKSEQPGDNDSTQFYKAIAAKSHQYIPEIMRMVKGDITRHCHELGLEFAWQPRFYDYIVRDEKQLFWIEQYIRENPENWLKDPNYIRV